jgi:Xaa-Pro aminopeptidase
VYEIVLEAQRVAIEATSPGATLQEIHQAAVRTIADGLRSLGILQQSLDEILEKESFKPYYMHRTCHYLGMDVHDVGLYYVDGEPRPLQPNMVITVEPGLYISQKADVDEAFRGIGIRIEDDVLVTQDGAEVLSEGAPKAPDDVERACS